MWYQEHLPDGSSSMSDLHHHVMSVGQTGSAPGRAGLKQLCTALPTQCMFLVRHAHYVLGKHARSKTSVAMGTPYVQSAAPLCTMSKSCALIEVLAGVYCAIEMGGWGQRDKEGKRVKSRRNMVCPLYYRIKPLGRAKPG